MALKGSLLVIVKLENYLVSWNRFSSKSTLMPRKQRPRTLLMMFSKLGFDFSKNNACIMFELLVLCLVNC